MQVLIESLSYGGAGIGTVDGKKLFVKKAVPGDLVEVEIINDKKTYAEAVIKKVVKPSKQRIDPTCSYFGECGGCQWQNVSYETQLKEKENIVKDSLARIGGLTGFEIEPIEPSNLEYGYRNKVILSVWKNSGRLHFGYNKEGSAEKVSISDCPVADSKINNSIKMLSEYFERLDPSTIDIDKIIYSSGSNSSSITINSKNSDSQLKELKNFSLKGNISFSTNEGNYFESQILGYNFISLPSAFNQANHYINEKMVSYVVEFLENTNLKSILDLYCGTGNFSIPISKFAKKVDGVDIDKISISLANKNAKLNEITNIRFHNEKVERSLKRPQQKYYDLVLLDPPRNGVKEIIQSLIKLKPKYIIYISCNPTTLSRDIKDLVHAGYKIIKIKPFDMFPQTFHIETVAILTYDKI